MLKTVTGYYHPASMEEALTLVRDHGAAFIAGGTLLVPERPSSIASLVDISRLGLGKIEETGRSSAAPEASIAMGATSTFQEISSSPLLKQLASGILPKAASSYRTSPLRNQATVGGVILAAPPEAEILPVLLALDARLSFASLEGTVSVPFEEYLERREEFRKEKKLLTGVAISQDWKDSSASFQRHAPIPSALPLVNCAVVLQIQDRKISKARVAVGNLHRQPVKLLEAQQLLEGKGIEEIREECQSRSYGRLLESCRGSLKIQSSIRPARESQATVAYKNAVTPLLILRGISEALEGK